MVCEHMIHTRQIGNCQVTNATTMLPTLIPRNAGELAPIRQLFKLVRISGTNGDPRDGAALVLGDGSLTGDEPLKPSRGW